MLREKSYIVDDEDNVIKIKFRDETLPQERVRIVCIWVENSKKQVLIAQRAKKMKLDPGLWGPSAAGGVTAGSDYQTAAAEELSEEIGLNIATENLELIAIGMMKYETRKNGKRMCAVFRVLVDWPIDKFTIEPNEVDQIKWIDKFKLIDDITVYPEKYLPSADRWEKYLLLN